MLRREAAEGIRPVAGDRLLAPNEYIITLGMHDYQKVGADPDLTSDAFAKHLADISANRGGKHMVTWSSGSSSRRTCTPASSAPAVLSTPMSSPGQQPASSPRHNQTSVQRRTRSTSDE